MKNKQEGKQPKEKSEWKAPVAAGVIYLCVLGVILFFSLRMYRQQTALYEKTLIDNLRFSMHITEEMQDEFATHFFEDHVRSPEVIGLMRRALSGDDKVRNQARKQLYTRMLPLQRTIRNHNFTHIHFHLPNNESFLRMHKPERHGDDLSAYRPSVRRANSERTHTSGYELGKILSAYRNVFPVIDRGEHLGSVELSMDFAYLRDALTETFEGEYVLLLKSGEMDRHLFAQQQQTYSGTHLGDGYVFNEPFSPTPLQQALNLKLGGAIPELLEKESGGILSTQVDDTDYVIAFMPLTDTENRHIGYLASYRQDDTPHKYFLAFIFRSMLLVAVATAILAAYLMKQRSYCRLAREQEKQRRLATGAEAGLWNINLRNGRSEFNSVWFDMLGYASEKPKKGGYSIFEFIEPEEHEKMRGLIKGCRDGKKLPSELELQLKHRSDHPVWVICRMEVIERDGHGTPLVLSGVTLDITARKRMQDLIRTSEERLNRLFQAIPDPVVVFNTRTRMPVTWNRNALGMFGYEGGAFSQMPASELIELEEQAGTDALESIFSQNGVTALPALARANGGESFPVKLSSSMITSGTETLCLVIFRDVTREKRSEDLLKENIEIKNNFISMVSHELRTPLFSILGFSSTLIKDNDKLDGETRKEFLSIIHDESTRLSSLIENVLTISRIDAGTEKYEKKTFNPAKTIEIVVGMLRCSSVNKWHKVSVQLPDTEARITFDPEAFKQVLMNLITNAMKFTPPGGTIDVTLSRKDSQVVVEVRDSGAGIPAEDLEKIFDKFYRSGHSATQANGTGLGLAIVRELVELHDGSISVTSAINEGSTFRVSLPDADAA